MPGPAFLFSLFSTSDPLDEAEFETQCMLKTIGYTESQSMLPLGDAVDEFAPLYYCAWDGVTCTDQRVTGIEWFKFSAFTVVTLQWLPPAVHSVNFFEVEIRKTLNTRLLPKRMERFLVASCGLYGKLDLRTLPDSICEVDLSDNNFGGEIDLRELPATLRKLYLESNMIRCALEDGGLLHRVLDEVVLQGQGTRLSIRWYGEMDNKDIFRVNNAKIVRCG